MRRFNGNMNGQQYLANTTPGRKVVHDLDPEMVECRIDEIIRTGNDLPYNSQSAANVAGYANCQYCIGPLEQVRQARQQRQQLGRNSTR